MGLYEVKMQHRIQWWETDAAGIIYFANYYRLMDTVMMEYFMSLPVTMPFKEYWGGQGSQAYDWSMLETTCRYFKTITFADLIDIHLWVAKKTNRTVHFACSFKHEGFEVARGYVITCHTAGISGNQKAVMPPQEVADAIEAAPWGTDDPPGM